MTAPFDSSDDGEPTVETQAMALIAGVRDRLVLIDRQLRLVPAREAIHQLDALERLLRDAGKGELW